MLALIRSLKRLRPEPPVIPVEMRLELDDMMAKGREASQEHVNCVNAICRDAPIDGLLSAVIEENKDHH